MTREETRQWAAEQTGGQDIKSQIRDAQALVDFVNGTNDAEIVCAARELADKVKG